MRQQALLGASRVTISSWWLLDLAGYESSDNCVGNFHKQVSFEI